ncbi:uncharacterized protein BDV17DRAFT_293935 [Aspergillus undulatus]|uniref:uncharacterized protein n=1 Tax=Aspergillus undulatus TaxID=1810928 RepID=UPI003CCE4E10
MSQPSSSDWDHIDRDLIDHGKKIIAKFDRIHGLINKRDGDECAAIVANSDFFKRWSHDVDLNPKEDIDVRKPHLHLMAPVIRDRAKSLLQELDKALEIALSALEERSERARKWQGQDEKYRRGILKLLDDIGPKVESLIRFGVDFEEGVL